MANIKANIGANGFRIGASMPARKRKGERYIDRWLREHPQVRVYLSREDYELVKRIAEERKTTMSEVIREAVKNLRIRLEVEKERAKAYNRGYRTGYSDAIDMFIDDPTSFYSIMMDRAKARGLKNFEPALFTAPCSVCGKPMIFNHKDPEWASKIRPYLLVDFKHWVHTDCAKKMEG